MFYRVTPIFNGVGRHDRRPDVGLRRRPVLARQSVLVDHPDDAWIEAVHQHEDVAQVLHHEQRELVVERSPESRNQAQSNSFSYKQNLLPKATHLSANL